LLYFAYPPFLSIHFVDWFTCDDKKVLGDPEQLTRAFQREGVDLRECCDFERDFATQPSSSSPAETSSRTGAMLEMVSGGCTFMGESLCLLIPTKSFLTYHFILALL
jgi:hypothetical protein